MELSSGKRAYITIKAFILNNMGAISEPFACKAGLIHHLTESRASAGRPGNTTPGEFLRGVPQKEKKPRQGAWDKIGTGSLAVASRGNTEGAPRFAHFYHHIFLVPPSQTRNRNRAIIPRQCNIENCARLQRRTQHPPQNHRRRSLKS